VHLTAAYEELLRLASERQSRLKEARKMWQFYDDVEDEEAWIKEKEQIMSSPDLGHDLTSIRLLLTKHKVVLSDFSCTVRVVHNGDNNCNCISISLKFLLLILLFDRFEAGVLNMFF